MLIYVGLEKPFESKSFHFFELFNEFFIAVINYHLMCFADFVDDSRREWTGMSMIVTISLNLAVNFSFIMFSALKKQYYKFRLSYYKSKLARLHKKIEKRAAERALKKNQISPRLAYILALERGSSFDRSVVSENDEGQEEVKQLS